MLLNIPFYINGHNQCVQTAVRCVINYFKGLDLSLDELDRLSGRYGDNWTWTSQVIPLLVGLDFDVKFYSSFDIKTLLAGEKGIKKLFSKDYEILVSHTDIDVMIKSVRKTIELAVWEQRKLNINDLEKCIIKNKIPLVVINYNKTLLKYRDKDNVPFLGHMVVVVGFDRENIIYHESGPRYYQKNKKLNKEIFLQAMNDVGTGNEIVVVGNAL